MSSYRQDVLFDASPCQDEGRQFGIVDGSINSISEVVRDAVLDRIKASGFSRRCPCFSDPDHGFQGYKSHSSSNGEDGVDDYDERNSVKNCELCYGLGSYNPDRMLGGVISLGRSRRRRQRPDVAG